MAIDAQFLLVLLIVATSAAWVLRSAWAGIRAASAAGKACSGCNACGGCPSPSRE